jgi:hypothetical protein
MRKKGFGLFTLIAILSLFLTQCSTSKVDPYQNTLNADKIIMNGGLDSSSSRGQAQSLYADALNNLSNGDPNYDFIYSHANFGLAMIGTWNGLATISSLLSSTNILGSTSGSCQPIDLSPYQTLLEPIIDNMLSPIVAHLQAVSTFTGFSFSINTAALVILPDMGLLSKSLSGQSFTIDMSGAYDLGEVDGMLSLFETVQGGAKLLFAYNGVLNELVNLLMGLTQTGCTMPNPLTDPNFGTLTSNGAQTISEAEPILADAAKNFSNSMSAIMARTGDSSAHGFMYYVDQNDNGKYDPGEPWGSEVLGQLIVVVLKLLPAISPGLASNSTISGIISALSGMDQKQAGQLISNFLFVNGVPGGLQIPISASLTLTLPAISTLIYPTDLQSVSNALSASITDTTGQYPLDIMPAIPVLVPRLLPVLAPLLASIAQGNSTLGTLIGFLPTLETSMFDSTGDAYTSLPVLPSIDLGAFFSNPPGDLKALAPLSYQSTTPLVGTSTYVAPEPFADGFVHTPDPTYNSGAGYWTSTASLVNGTCDNCVGSPFTAGYAGEWYSDPTGNYIKWDPGTPVCNSVQSNQPCFVNIYGDGKYHKAGDIIEQADEEQAFPSFTTTNPSALSWSGETITAYSDTGTDRVADNLELGYDPVNNPDPYGDDITCNTLNPLPPFLPLPASLSWPIPNTPPYIGDGACGEKNGMPDIWDGSLYSLMYGGIYISLAGINLGVVTPFGPVLSPDSTPFFPRYHYWPGSTIVDKPEPLTINMPESLFYQLVDTIAPSTVSQLSSSGITFIPNALDSIAVTLPNDSYMFFPDPTFGGLLTVGQFNWCSKYQNYIGIPYNASAPCDAISYSTANMTNAQMNQYVNIVNLLIGVVNGTVNLSSLGL